MAPEDEATMAGIRGVDLGGSTPEPLERVTQPPKPDLVGRRSVDGYGCGAASRSVVGSSRTVLANSTTSAERWTAARFRSRMSHRHSVRPPQRHPLADAPAGTQVRIGDDVLAPPARLATSGRVGSHSLRAAGSARSRNNPVRAAARPYTSVSSSPHFLKEGDHVARREDPAHNRLYGPA
jgi:hypothetical protein